MTWAHLGAALFLAGALTQASRITLPLPAGDATPGSALAEHEPVDGDVFDHAARAETLLPHPAPRLITARPGAFALACAAAASVAAIVLGDGWPRHPALAALVVVILPIVVSLTVTDVAVHRLPNRLTGLLAVTVAVGLAFASGVVASSPRGSAPFVGTDAPSLRRAVVGAIALGVFYLVLALLGGGAGMGLGDVKLAPSLGALMAWVGWDVWLTGAFAAFLLGGVWGVVLMLRGQGRHARMPFGPFMIVGALAAICFA